MSNLEDTDVWQVYSEVVSDLPNSPYTNLLYVIAYEGDEGILSDPKFACPKCGRELDDWSCGVRARHVQRLLPEVPPLPEAISQVTFHDLAHQIEYFRSDCSPYLVHLTREANLALLEDTFDSKKEYREYTAPEVLWFILVTKTLRAAKGKGMRTPAVCFTEKPLAALKDTLVGREARIRTQSSLHWRCYGLMFEKEYLRRMGVVPVLPLSPTEINGLPPDFRFRAVPFSSRSNWHHEREWRFGKDLEFELEQAIVLVPTFDQAELFRKTLAEYTMRVKGVIPLLDVFAAI